MRHGIIVCAFVGMFLPGSAAARRERSDLTLVIEGKDDYEIYSLLLRTEVAWNIKTWTIQQVTERGFLPMCIQPPADQEAIYRAVIEDFQRKNEKRFWLQRQFDLPAYDLIRPTDRVPVQDREVLFEVSAVGFNKDHNRALVYVAHHCGRLCGGGGYHLIVKEKEQWTTDQEFRGAPSCVWKS